MEPLETMIRRGVETELPNWSQFVCERSKPQLPPRKEDYFHDAARVVQNCDEWADFTRHHITLS
ncbi:hypothetical protein KO516_16990 [Citreicella sp. C3M06]|uniref:hypothetical protein n=1 Tax=Citreicella sp. C3M06 TaxID=2841564 RepID=UPI001C080F9F|nr:hypothetical protein [Citreicella sp. C3M06]MBU2962488.1 hypothetical protein [Citreicella sp. C3M06]